MENTEKEKFESLWADFTTLVKGKLITTAKKQTLSLPLAKLILSDASGSWGDEYSTYGRWLHLLAQKDPSKAELIREILLKDLCLSEISLPRVLPDYCNFLIPGMGVLAGYTASVYYNMGRISQVATVLLPAFLLYPAVKKFRDIQAKSAIDLTIDAYIEQLEKYKNSVISILS